jgi:hypothetical protein
VTTDDRRLTTDHRAGVTTDDRRLTTDHRPGLWRS